MWLRWRHEFQPFSLLETDPAQYSYKWPLMVLHCTLSQQQLMLLTIVGHWVCTVSLPKCLGRVAKLRGSESEICGGFSSQDSSL